jgi:hypothetical protein
MAEDDPPPADDVPELSSDALAIADDAAELTRVHPDALIRGFRDLQQRIPGFTQLSVEEEQALIRVATLDPDFLEAGVRAAGAWSQTKTFAGVSEEELREWLDEIRHWDEAEREVGIFLKGISAANRKRRHRLGRAVLRIYMFLGEVVDIEANRHLRPYYEEMKRAYRARKRKRSKASEKPDKREE